MRVHELREQRAGKVAEMRSIAETADKENRDLNDGERGRFDGLKGEVTNLEARIGRAEQLAEFERHAEAEPVRGHGGARELEARFSIGRAIQDLMQGGRLTGCEAEFNAEHRCERASGFTIPTSALLPNRAQREQRAILTTTPAGGPGGNLIPTQLGPLVDRLRPALKVEALGATVLTGLTANLDLPRMKSSGTVSYVGEHVNGPLSDPEFDKIEIRPKTVTGSYEMSRRMLLQAVQLEQVLRADLSKLLAEKLDMSAVFGFGDQVFPTGITVTPGTKEVSFGPPAPDPGDVQQWFDFTAAMIAAPDGADVSGATGFLANTTTKATLNRLLDNQQRPIGAATFFQGERVEWSNQMLNNIGVNSDSAIVYGAWDNLIIGYFSAISIVFNPYADSIARKGGAFLHAFLDHDIALRHPEAFAWSKNVPNAEIVG